MRGVVIAAWAVALVCLSPVAEALEITAPAQVEQSATASQTATRVSFETGDPVLDQVLLLVNVERAKVGLAPLRVDPQLMLAAQGHSEYQAKHMIMTHDGPAGLETVRDRIEATGYRPWSWAENVAFGYPTAEALVEAWMQSPHHRENILRSTVTEIGLGLAFSESDVPFWTQVFAAPLP